MTSNLSKLKGLGEEIKLKVSKTNNKDLQDIIGNYTQKVISIISLIIKNKDGFEQADIKLDSFINNQINVFNNINNDLIENISVFDEIIKLDLDFSEYYEEKFKIKEGSSLELKSLALEISKILL